VRGRQRGASIVPTRANRKTQKKDENIGQTQTKKAQWGAGGLLISDQEKRTSPLVKRKQRIDWKLGVMRHNETANDASKKVADKEKMKTAMI